MATDVAVAPVVVPPLLTAKKPPIIDRAADLLRLCPQEQLTPIDSAFRSLMTMDAVTLSRLPGTPATVMLAQTLSYLKSTNKLREPLRDDQPSFQRAYAILVTAHKSKGRH